MQAELVETVQREADKIAARVGAHVLALVDNQGRIVASAGSRAGAWPRGTSLRPREHDGEPAEFVVDVPAGAFRVIGAPLRLGDAVIGSIELGRAIDHAYAVDLASLARGHSAVLIDGRVVATTLPASVAAELSEESLSFDPRVSSVVSLAGESFAVRAVSEPPATFLTLASIDAEASSATKSAFRGLWWIAGAALLLAAGAMIAMREVSQTLA